MTARRGQKLINSLSCDHLTLKQDVVEKKEIELARLNELLFTENRIIEFIVEHRPPCTGYMISGHCGITASMMLAASYVLNKSVTLFRHI